MQRIVVLGAGFAGLWAAIGAARKLDEIGIGLQGWFDSILRGNTAGKSRCRSDRLCAGSYFVAVLFHGPR